MAPYTSFKYVVWANLGTGSHYVLGVARRASEDDMYEGYFIPEGTIVIPNAW